MLSVTKQWHICGILLDVQFHKTKIQVLSCVQISAFWLSKCDVAFSADLRAIRQEGRWWRAWERLMIWVEVTCIWQVYMWMTICWIARRCPNHKPMDCCWAISWAPPTTLWGQDQVISQGGSKYVFEVMWADLLSLSTVLSYFDVACVDQHKLGTL